MPPSFRACCSVRVLDSLGVSAEDSGLYALAEAIVIENAMNPDAAHFAHGAVGKNSGVFDRNVSLIIKAISHPTAQCFRRKPAFVHGDVERMFVVVSARADRAQFLHESFAVPKPSVIR